MPLGRKHTMNTVISPRPNYRILDRTGGGVTHDIFAESLEAAIEAGRDWIEDGEFEKGIHETTLECGVRALHVVPSEDCPDALPALADYGLTRTDDGKLITHVLPEDRGEYAKMIHDAAHHTATPDLVTDLVIADELDADGYYLLTVTPGPAWPKETIVDDEEHDCSGTLAAADAPECIGSEDGEHDWVSPHSVVGGIRENPGVWGSAHGQIKCRKVCRHCGMYRVTDHGATDSSNGPCVTSVSCGDADETSLAWVESRRSAE